MSRKRRKTARKKAIRQELRLEASINSVYFSGIAPINSEDVYYTFAGSESVNQKLVAWQELAEIITYSTFELYREAVVRVLLFEWKSRVLRKLLKIYSPIFDQRIFTEKLLGKPSPGLPPPYMLAFI